MCERQGGLTYEMARKTKVRLKKLVEAAATLLGMGVGMKERC
jgi:hypothetical protein